MWLIKYNCVLVRRITTNHDNNYQSNAMINHDWLHFLANQEQLWLDRWSRRLSLHLANQKRFGSA